MSVARLRLAPVGPASGAPRWGCTHSAASRLVTFSGRTPFFERPIQQGNLPVPQGPLPADRPETGL
jgi:hypothetical protein